jgi:hypothetical protein
VSREPRESSAESRGQTSESFAADS